MKINLYVNSMSIFRFPALSGILALLGLNCCAFGSSVREPDAEASLVLEPRLCQPLSAGRMAWLGVAPQEKATLDWVQARINQVPFRTDRVRWGVADYWADPEAFLRGGGDCEDYALAKMAALRSLGWAAEDLEVLVVADMEQGGRAHAVLRARLAGVDWLLDNQSANPRPAARERRYLPLQGYGCGL